MTTKLFVLACLLAVASARFVAKPNFDLSTLTSRIIGGHDAKPGQFPHQISLQMKWPRVKIYELTHFCGGSILNKEWILTAAHCLVPLEQAAGDPKAVFLVKAGKHNLERTEDTEQTSSIDRFFIHEKYDREPEYVVGPYDIGLIKLKNPLKLNKRVAAIGLPEKNSEPTGKLTLSGWGAIDDDMYDPEYPAILQTVDLEVVDRKTCNKAVNAISEEAGEILPIDLVDETNVCSGPMTGGKASCGGDSGGPLISKDSDGKTVVVGVVSWGINPCGSKGAPSVHARTSFFVDWIGNIISKN